MLMSGEQSVAALPARVAERVALVTKRASLTGQQARVLAALAGGLTTYGIAAAPDVSPRTVEKHFEGIFEKLGVSTRAGVLAVLLTVTS
jgi:DNA-binding NarL/FixJ family response regulator